MKYLAPIRIARSRVRLYSSASLPSAPSTKYSETTCKFARLPETKEFIKNSSQYLLPVYARPNLVLSHGKGSYVWDTEGNKFLDFSAGIAVNALGHADEGVTKVMTEQSSKLLHTSNVYHNEWAPILARLIITLTQNEGGLGYTGHSAPETSAKVFFSNSGTEANEGALKIARKVGKDRWTAETGIEWDADPSKCTKTRIACFEGSFHGRSMGSVSVTVNPKYQNPFTPLIPGVEVGKLNDLDGISKIVTKDTCAVIVEPIQGEGGVNTAGVSWLRALRKRCNEVGAILIYDEIQCGLYRTGTLWAHSAYPADCHPDIVTMAKPLANGYPIGAILVKEKIAVAMAAGSHGTTFGGSPLACAIGYHVLGRLADPSFGVRMKETSEYLSARLGLLPKWFPNILEERVRGRGLIRGLGFKDGQHPGRIVELARERGLLVLTAGKEVARLVPSLTVSKEEISVAAEILESSLGQL
ncbi:hypothetical protein APHAL10511_002111 [Amanita phalloides]|nr:hypothetical protein APHAL10511_002111 [Amanita phalloides]